MIRLRISECGMRILECLIFFGRIKPPSLEKLRRVRQDFQDYVYHWAQLMDRLMFE
jgi:hypothetical protein